MAEIRTPEESDRSRIAELMRIAFNVPPAWTRHVAPVMQLRRFLGAYEKGRLVAMAQAWELEQWFGGRALPMAGIAAVTSAPERRGAGLAPEVVREILRKCRAEGAVVSTLYPSRAAVYRRLGYEFAGILTQLKVSIQDLPSAGSPGAEIDEFAESDLPAVRACYRTMAAEHTGMVDCAADDWWTLRVLRRWNPDVAGRAVVVRGADGVEGYASFQLDAIPDSWGYRVTCTHMLGASSAGLRGLLDYFRSYRGLGQFLVWYGPANDPLGLLAGGGADSIQPIRTVRFMTRLLDVAAALEGRGYRPTEGSALIRVADDLFPDNQGPFRIEASEGKVRVERVKDAKTDCVIPIGALSSLFSGYASTLDLARAGILRREDPNLPFLGSLFAGPIPWMTDFF